MNRKRKSMGLDGKHLIGHSKAAKLTYSQACTIRERLSKGEKQAALAKEYGVSLGSISSISVGRTYNYPLTTGRLKFVSYDH